MKRYITSKRWKEEEEEERKRAAMNQDGDRRHQDQPEGEEAQLLHQQHPQHHHLKEVGVPDKVVTTACSYGMPGSISLASQSGTCPVTVDIDPGNNICTFGDRIDESRGDQWPEQGDDITNNPDASLGEEQPQEEARTIQGGAGEQ